MSLSPAQLAAAVPRADAGRWARPLARAMDEFGIASPRRMAAFLGECAHESADFRSLVENLNYSAEALANTWPGRYSTGQKIGGRFQPNHLARRLARQPEAIANNVYANRLGNGDEASGEGWRYRGRGLIQITGRANYRLAGDALGMDFIAEPGMLEQPEPAARSAAWYFVAAGLLPFADRGEWLAISRGVNLGNPRSSAMPIAHAQRHERIELALAALEQGGPALA